MQILSFLDKILQPKRRTEDDLVKLNGNAIPLKYGDENRGWLIIHEPSVREQLDAHIKQSVAHGASGHNGIIGKFLVDQLSESTPIIISALQAGKLVQIVGPDLLSGIGSGAYKLMESSGGHLSSVVSSSSSQIVGQLRFVAANGINIVSPMIVYSILNAIVGVRHLQLINEKLSIIVDGLNHIERRQQVGVYGKLISSMSTLSEVRDQRLILGTFSDDMKLRLCLATHDIKACMTEQLLSTVLSAKEKMQVMGQFSTAKKVSVIDQYFESRGGFDEMDQNMMTTGITAASLCTELWILHDLEYTPQFVPHRLKIANKEIELYKQHLERVESQDRDMRSNAKNCVADFNVLQKIINREEYKKWSQYEEAKPVTKDVSQDKEPSCLFWLEGEKLNSVIVDLSNDEQSSNGSSH